MVTPKKIELPNGNTFEGVLKNGKPEGKGKLRTKTGSYYDGERKNGKFNGKGEIKLENGEVYEGELKNSVIEGKGKMRLKGGNIYEGERKNGKYNGKGKMKYSNGNIYEGNWKDGVIEGKGKMTYRWDKELYNCDAKMYEGGWKSGERHGLGKELLIIFHRHSDEEEEWATRNECVFEGKFENGKEIGKFKLIFEKGDICEGNIESKTNDYGIFRYFSSNGIIHFKNGDIYEGEFIRPIYKNFIWFKGMGKLKFIDGTTIEGIWNDGIFESGKIIYPSGIIFEGMKHGIGNVDYNSILRERNFEERIRLEGKIIYPNGDIYEGEWDLTSPYESNNENWIPKPESQKDNPESIENKNPSKEDINERKIQIIEYENGDIYEGECKDGKPNGKGTMKYANGCIFEGYFHENFKLIGNSEAIQGQGIMTYPNGDIYKGGIEGDKKDGIGVMKYANGYIYKGPWRNDMRRTVKYGYGEEGGCMIIDDYKYGILTFPDGSYYKGSWYADEPENGKKYDNNGELLDCNYKFTLPIDTDDNIEYDINKNYFYDEEACHTYNFEKLLNELKGKSNFERKFYKNGDVYEGELKDGLPNGLGRMYYHNDDIYQGYWKIGKYDGVGEILMPNNYKDTKYFYDISNYRYIGNIELSGGLYMYKIKYCYGHRKNGKINGYAKFIHDYSHVLQGHRTNGERNGIFIENNLITGSYKDYKLYNFDSGKFTFPYVSYSDKGRYGHGKMFLHPHDLSSEIIDLGNLNNYETNVKNNVLKCLKLPDVWECPNNLNKLKSILIFDTETTGLSENSSIIQFGGIYGLLSGNEFVELYRVNQYIDVTQKIEKDAYETHHISNEFLKEYHYFERYVDRLLPLFKNADLIVGHNIKFDIEMMRKECERIGIYVNWDKLKVFDTMRNTIKLVGATFDDGGYKWPKLQELYIHLFGKNFDDAHSAIADVEATRDCFLKLLSDGYIFDNLGFKGKNIKTSEKKENEILTFIDNGKFNNQGINLKTGIEYDEWGFDINGFNIFGYNKDGIDENGIDRIGYDEKGYDKNGIDKNGYNKKGEQIFDEDGYNKDGYNREGFDRYGHDKYGYDKDGYTSVGNKKEGFHRKSVHLFNKYDKHGFDKNGIHKDTGIKYDKKGFMRNGYNRYTKGPFDENGLDIDGVKFKSK